MSRLALLALALICVLGSAARAQTLTPGQNATVLHNRVSLSAAQVLALNTTPIVLTPPANVGQYLTLLKLSASLVFNTTAYVAANAPFVAYSKAPTISMGGVQTGFLTSTVSTVNQSTGTTAAGSLHTAAAALGSSLVLTAAGNPTTGNSPVNVDIWWLVSTP